MKTRSAAAEAAVGPLSTSFTENLSVEGTPGRSPRLLEPELEAAEAEHILQLPFDLIIRILEVLNFDALLAARSTCTDLRNMSLSVSKAVLQRKEQLCVPLLLPFGGSITWLELEGVSSDWLPRLGCVLGILPRLQWLFIRRLKSAPQSLAHSLADTATLAIAGALQAGACRHLHHLNIDERLPEEKVILIARAMHPNSGLLFGASHGHESVIEEMLTRGASPEVALEDGANALIVACYHGGKCVETLLKHGANVAARRHDGVSALIMASNRGHTTTVEALLEARADVNMAMRDGTTALHTATYKGHNSVVGALIAAGAHVHARCHDGVAALLMAAKAGREELVRMLLGAGAEVDAALKDGGTPLLAAAYKGHAGCVEALLQARARVDACRKDGLTPLCQASKAGHHRCVELLLHAKANVEAAGAVYGTTSLLMASKGGHSRIVRMLLAHDADTEVAGRAYGTTSLVAAAQHGHAEVTRLLLDGGADPLKQLNDGSLALDKAREQLKQLIEHNEKQLAAQPEGSELDAKSKEKIAGYAQVVELLEAAMAGDADDEPEPEGRAAPLEDDEDREELDKLSKALQAHLDGSTGASSSSLDSSSNSSLDRPPQQPPVT